MTNRKLARILLLIAIVAVAIMIFLFSARDAQRSTADSDAVAEVVIHLVEPQYDSLPETRRLTLRGTVTLFIRKLAHFSEFALLGALLFAYFRLSPEKWQTWRLVLRSLGLAALYACTDELHQSYVAGRQAALLDVGIDSLGALTAIVILAVCWRLFSSGRRKKRKK